MYGIALSVAACLRAGTRADVSWLVSAEGMVEGADRSGAVAFTPGGGRIGSIDQGPIDIKLSDFAGRWDTGRLVDIEISEVDALIAGVPTGGRARCLLVPADALPSRIWEIAVARKSFCLVCEMDDNQVSAIRLYEDDSIATAEEAIRRIWDSGTAGSAMAEGALVSVFRAVPQLVVVGESPIGNALTAIAGVLGWTGRIVGDAGSASGVIASLSALDKVVVAAHDLDLAGAALLAALESQVGYIGSVGSRRMQENRGDWLAYRGVTDLTRVHGPAGLDIGAATPEEVAVAILAEMIGAGGDPAGARAVEPGSPTG
jgi:xanthine dehydrogenase accessory factor